MFPHHDCVCISLLPQTYHMPCQSYPPWCDHLNNTLRGIKSINSSLCNFLQPLLSAGRKHIFWHKSKEMVKCGIPLQHSSAISPRLCMCMAQQSVCER
jgi:hypothetical protein